MAKPLLFITGFLGAGKTTLLRGLLDELKALNRTADVILNDFENAEIDASTLQGEATSIFPIAASCACCGSLEDLVKLCLAAQSSESDVMLIELNGTADPLPLLETFTLLEKRLRFHPRWQVGVVDARHWEGRGEFVSLEHRQLEAATHWQLTHSEKLSETEMESVFESVRHLNQFADLTNASQLALELSKACEFSKPSFNTQEMIDSRWKVGSDRGHELSHRFSGHQIPMTGRYQKLQVIRLLEALPDRVVRAKALVELEDDPGSRWLFNRTGRHPVEDPEQVEGLSRTGSSLLCIGPNLSPEELQNEFDRHIVGRGYLTEASNE